MPLRTSTYHITSGEDKKFKRGVEDKRFSRKWNWNSKKMWKIFIMVTWGFWPRPRGHWACPRGWFRASSSRIGTCKYPRGQLWLLKTNVNIFYWLHFRLLYFDADPDPGSAFQKNGSGFRIRIQIRIQGIDKKKLYFSSNIFSYLKQMFNILTFFNTIFLLVCTKW